MAKFQDLEKWRRPEMFLAELLNKSVRGELSDKSENPQLWYRALVVAVDVEGGKLENPKGQGVVSHMFNGKNVDIPARLGPVNPRNSIKARLITGEFDQFVDDDDLKVYWPMMGEHDSIPIKPDEHVYVTFEDRNFNHGLWFGKVAGHENVNFFRGQDSFTLNSEDSSLAAKFGDSPKSDVPVANKDKDATGRQITQSLSKLFGG